MVPQPERDSSTRLVDRGLRLDLGHVRHAVGEPFELIANLHAAQSMDLSETILGGGIGF